MAKGPGRQAKAGERRDRVEGGEGRSEGQLAIIRFIRGKTRESSLDEKLPKCGTVRFHVLPRSSRLGLGFHDIYPPHTALPPRQGICPPTPN